YVVDAQDELTRVERFWQVVVGSGFETCDAVVGLGQRGQHEDRNVALGAQRFRQLHAAFAGHHHVEHEEVEIQARQLAARLRGRARDGNAKTVLGQELPEQIADTGVVVDYQKVKRIVIRRIDLLVEPVGAFHAATPGLLPYGAEGRRRSVRAVPD